MIIIKTEHFFSQAALTMSIPGYGTVSGVRPETDPLVTRGTENAICFKF